MGEQCSPTFSKTSQGAGQPKAGVWSRGCLAKLSREECITGQKKCTLQHTRLGDINQAISSARFRPPQAPLLKPWRLTVTGGVGGRQGKIDQHHPGAEKQVTGPAEARKVPRATSRPQRVGTGCSAGSLNPVAAEHMAGAPHSKEDATSQ